MRKNYLIFLFLICYQYSWSQETFPVNGVKDVKPNLIAFINASIITDADNKLENATLIIRNGIIENVGVGLTAPSGAVVYDCLGKTIYPSFIDLYTSYGLPDAKRSKGQDGPQFLSNKAGAYGWNEAIKSEFNAIDYFALSQSKAEEMRKQGFSVVLSLQKDGIARGTSIVVSLAEKKENLIILKEKATSNFSFSKGSSNQDYPSSLMGSIALLRQTFYDAEWVKANAGKTETNLSLSAINEQKSMPMIFETSDVYDIFRAQKIADEFNLQFIYKASGNEYQRITELKKLNPTIITSINFPKAYDVEDYFDAMNISISDMKNWELAPYNLAYLENQKVKFALTTADLKNTSDFLKNLRLAVKCGLSEKQALNSLTLVPAQILKMTDQIGMLKIGMRANFIVTTGNIFKDSKSILLENWIDGEKYIIQSKQEIDIRGNYSLTIPNNNLTLQITGTIDEPEANLLRADSSKIKGSISLRADQFSLVFDPSIDSTTIGKIRLNGTVLQTPKFSLIGNGSLANGTKISWTATRIKEFIAEPIEAEKVKKLDSVGKVIYPFVAFGNESQPKQEKIIIKNATVWTNEKQGKLENTDVLIDNGKIINIGKNIEASGAKVIDGTGKHLTSGIIDEHSHIAITRGVNEGTQSVSSEVRIGDALEADDINIYRQLSGGVTISQLLHGSANPIGGQSAIIKLRWGKTPEELKLEGADEFIKFALGENVKQTNWGDNQRERFPQTRMGVEQVYIDAFTRAREYEKEQKAYELLSSSKKAMIPTTRRDLELDALVEILNKKRFITCHSYVQSEINMLMHVADTFKFKVNTFTHILEGYKVADKMRMHGVSASTFSDWWAYKFEVIDAIPYNAAILTKAGVNTAINSDDAEMARRLNQEAAKSVMYGGLTEEEAWKMVTLNPAKMLHLDQRVGSIKEGKDADVVLWNDNPLSIYARVEKTIIDGTIYYDYDQDVKARLSISTERERLIQKMLNEKKIGMPTQKPIVKEKKLYHCDDSENEMSY